MVNKVSGVFDILSALIIFLNMYDVIGNVLVIAVIVYLIVRTIAFYGEAENMIGGLIALVLLVNLLYHMLWAGYIIVIYLLIRGVLGILKDYRVV